MPTINRYTERTPRPANPILRPAYQGSNPVADIFSLWALQTTVTYLPRIAKNPDDVEARKQMLYVTLHGLYLCNLHVLKPCFFFCRYRVWKRRGSPMPRDELSCKCPLRFRMQLRCFINNFSQISGLNKKGPKYKHPGYVTDLPIIPHGIRSDPSL